jgi:hypothetical protein
MSCKNSGAGNPFYGMTHNDVTRHKMSDSVKIGIMNMPEEDVSRLSRMRSEAASGINNPFYGKQHDNDTRHRMSKARALGIASGRIHAPRGLKGWYQSSKSGESFYHDSFYEFLRMKLLDEDDSIVYWTKRHGIMIDYVFEGVNRIYVPDFLIEYRDQIQIVEEVKGYEEPNKLSAKTGAALNFTVQNGMKFRFINAYDLEQIVKSAYGKSIVQLRKEFQQ